MRSIDRRSYQFHTMALYELMSQQAVMAKNARRAWQRLAVIWLVNRLLILMAVLGSAYAAFATSRWTKHMFGVPGGSLAALLVGSAAILAARTIWPSAFV